MVDGRSKERRTHGSSCTKQPTFGAAGTKRAKSCAEYAQDGMVAVKDEEMIHPSSCTKWPGHGVDGTKTAKFLSRHANDGDGGLSQQEASLPLPAPSSRAIVWPVPSRRRSASDTRGRDVKRQQQGEVRLPWRNQQTGYHAAWRVPERRSFALDIPRTGC